MNNANERYLREVMTFGNHLGADQDINLMAVYTIENSLMALFASGCVTIHPCDPGSRE